MTEPSKAVFLSYASQDVEAARRICDALRAAGSEVWFDQSELRGGDAWDHHIRRQIADCALFVPIISAHTQARSEGYFRLEWDLAEQRSHMIARSRAFIIPVCVDDTPDRGAEVPESFLKAQWTRLPGAVTPTAFVERLSNLLSSGPAHAPVEARSPPSGAPATADAAQVPAPSPVALRPTKPVLAVIAAAALIGIGYLAVDRFDLSKRAVTGTQERASPGQAAVPAPSAVPEKSIAVLPFVNMSSDKEQEYFSDGLSEEMIDLLSQVPDLHVSARTSSFSFKGKADDIPTIAQKLHVAHVLEGSVRKAGNVIRVTAQLIRADSGYHLWSKTYDRDIKDIFKVQDEIAAAVVDALKVKLGPMQPAAAHRSSNTEAYNQYLLGRHFNQRGNPDGWRRAIEAYHKAIALDPHYAAAYANLAVAESSLADQAGDAAALRQAQADAEEAVALGPEEADGYASRGFLRSAFGWDWAGAQADFAKALILDPASARVQSNYASMLESLGRLPEAIAAQRKATELDPLSSGAWESLGSSLTANRDYQAAGEAVGRTLEIQPDSVFGLYNLARLQLLEDHAAQALATSGKIEFEVFRLQVKAMAEHSLKNVQGSQQALDELIAKYAHESAFQVAEVYAWRGERDQAFAWLERAYQQRDSGLADVKVDPLLQSLYADPRYPALLRKMNLPE